MGRPKGWRRVRKHFSYTVEEAARNQGVSRGTVLRWLKQGLPCLREQRPYLILGADFVAFLKERKKPQNKCALDEFYCFKCRAPRHAAFNEAEETPSPGKSRRLTALCSECATTMHKAVSEADLASLKGILNVTSQPAPASIGKSTEAP